MNFQQAIESGFRNYINFTGRATRSELWYWLLFNFLGGIVTSILDGRIPQDAASSSGALHPLNYLFVLIMFLPTIAVDVRRLHDTNRSGWWLLIGLIPIIGVLVLLLWYCQKGDEGANQYGENPL